MDPGASHTDNRSSRSKQLLELEITGLSHGGRGVARSPEGEVVFVEGGLPGDRVRALRRRRRRRHSEARVQEILVSSPHRCAALCRHQEVCGGCPLQTLDYECQLAEKARMLRDAWERIGGLQPPEIEEILPCEQRTHYRNKMEFGFSDRPWSTEAPPRRGGFSAASGETAGQPGEESGRFGLGQHARGIHSVVFDLEECWLQSELTAPLLDCVRRFVYREGGGPEAVWHYKKQSGYWRFVVVREGKRTGERMVNLVTSAGGDPRAAALAERLLEEFPGELSSIVNTVNERPGQVAQGCLDRVLHGSAVLREKLGRRTFELGPQAFFQTNTLQAERLYGVVREFAGLRPNDSLLDLYCGTGSISICLAEDVRSAVGVELVEEAVRAARRNAELNGLDNLRFHQGDVKDLLRSGTIERPDLVIVDPPRGGLHPKVTQRLIHLGAQRLVYVSCNPATQARDAALLCEGGYRPERLRPVDMFPHTFHVEAVASFRKTN